MHILCPHCKNLVEWADQSLTEDISCSVCGQRPHPSYGAVTEPAPGKRYNGLRRW